jgi:hypothetical protein
MTNIRIHKHILGQMRKSFIQQGGYDGRYRPKVVKSKKVYNRQKSKKITY